MEKGKFAAFPYITWPENYWVGKSCNRRLAKVTKSREVIIMFSKDTNNQYKKNYELSEMVLASYLRNNLGKGEGYDLSFYDFGLAEQMSFALSDISQIKYVPTNERTMLIMEVLLRLTNLPAGKAGFPVHLSFDQELASSLMDAITQSVFWVTGGHQTLTYPLVLQDHKANPSLGMINKRIEAEITNDAQRRNNKRKNHCFSINKAVNSLISLWRKNEFKYN